MKKIKHISWKKTEGKTIKFIKRSNCPELIGIIFTDESFCTIEVEAWGAGDATMKEGSIRKFSFETLRDFDIINETEYRKLVAQEDKEWKEKIELKEREEYCRLKSKYEKK